MKKPSNPKERNLVKGALRRVFSRSELRQSVLQRVAVEHTNPDRPRVKRWAYCELCGMIVPKNSLAVDHIEPVVPVDTKLEFMEWTDVVNRIWCDMNKLQAICETCHNAKTKAENRERRGKKK